MSSGVKFNLFITCLISSSLRLPLLVSESLFIAKAEAAESTRFSVIFVQSFTLHRATKEINSMPISYQLIEKDLRFFTAINIILNFIPFELGLKKTYENNAKLALTLKMIPALSFVPLSDVESAFTLVIDKICQTADQFDIPTDIFEKIDKLASYFQKTYIKKRNNWSTTV